jgi:hypothetical protein
MLYILKTGLSQCLNESFLWVVYMPKLKKYWTSPVLTEILKNRQSD